MNAKKNVLLVINSGLINAGVPNVVMAMVRNLSKQFTFDIITYNSINGQYDAEFESYGGKVFRLSLIEYEKHKLIYPLRYFQIRKFLKNILKQKKYDIIHCHNGIESGIFLKYAKHSGIQTRIVHAHGTYFRKGKNKILLWYQSQCKKLIQKNTTAALACSTQAGESLFISKDFINVLNPVEISNYLNLEKKRHCKCNLLQIGYFCENKNQLFSIELLKSLLDEKFDATLTLIGFSQDEVYYTKMLNTINELSVKENVCFLPSDADKPQMFSNTDIVLLPSFTEGLPLVALESQSAHVATLLSDHISSDADLGLAFYVEYGNLQKWKNAVKQIYSRIDNLHTINIDTELIEMGRWCNRIGAIYNGQ